MILLVLFLISTLGYSSYCPRGQTVTLNPYGRSIPCHSSSECPEASECYSKSGYCCESLAPKLTECPQGMAPIKVSQNRVLQCKVSEKNSCPDGSVCVPGSTSSVAHCCMADPTEGCAAGSRVLRDSSTRKPLLCNPQTLRQADTCPGEASCQWNFELKQYQCCEPDDGCPRSHRPMLDDQSVVRICDPGKNVHCPRGGICWYNFWHGRFQCCQAIVESLCPINMVAFLSPDGPVACKTSKECPEMYSCEKGMCCGQPGTCPLSLHSPARDERGHLRPCFAPNFVDCPGDSSCEASIYPMMVQHKWKQQLCCAKSVLTCAEGGTPYPSHKDAMPCDKSKIDACPVDTKCQASNVPKTYICCRTKRQTNQLCPAGWVLENNQLKYCKPTSHDCLNSCLMSPHTRRFLCCSPLMRAQSRLKQLSLVSLDGDYTCPLFFVGPEIQNRLEKRCTVPGSRGDCSPGFVCATSLEDVNVNLCCGPSDNQKDESNFRCPNPGQVEVVENGRNRFCDAYSNDCPRGSTCHSALNSYQMMICCYSSPSETPVCPSDSLPQPSAAAYVPCDLNRANQCDNGYLCVPSANQPQTAICCSRINPNSYVCPNQQSLYLENGRPRICSLQQANPCPTGFTCTQTVSNVGTYVCCSLPSTATCPPRYTVVTGVNGAAIHCNLNSPNDCPAETQCLDSPNQAQNAVCCRSSDAPRVCPVGMSALLLPNNQVERCTGPGSACPVSGYTCQLSNYLSAWVCCGRDREQILCPNGDVPYSQQLGSPFRCTLYAFPSECPANYQCQVSSQASANVCCPSNVQPNPPGPNPPNPTPGPYPPYEPTEPTFRPPTPDLTCPVGWSPYEDSEGAYHFCQHPLDTQCPQGFSCTQSSVSGVFVCCRLASNLKCANTNSTPYIINNAPRLCSLSSALPNPCPYNFSCQSSNIPQVNICCPLTYINTITRPIQQISPQNNGQSNYYTNQIMCVDGSIPAYVGQQMLQCNYLNTPDCCPPTYTCSLSTQRGINYEMNRSLARLSSRKEGRSPCSDNEIAVDGVDCFDSRECPGLSMCNIRSNDVRGDCCVKPQCQDGYDLAMPTEMCHDDSECREDNICQPFGEIKDYKVCCKPKKQPRSECIGRETLRHAGKSVYCRTDTQCPYGYECSEKTSNNQSMCCKLQNVNNICPDNRSPYKDSRDLPMSCKESDPTSLCPAGYVCKKGPMGDAHCCSLIAFCPPGKIPEINEDTNHAKK
ncbi:unnamed protein product [Bursaphelenchus okinawaensis]|uniref:Uncharacterized protein n=1 Tax=Bursaphelenchus okinawaensis TaxID=465554 RepID=A0A811K693_9BILA|nr:unnamed protein product [Bursaphelenchus okinawaensis]CAG9093750.1 unnamed protein product [Bursaphelenchus okinawaensis]